MARRFPQVMSIYGHQEAEALSNASGLS